MKKRLIACLIGTVCMIIYAAVRFGGTSDFLTAAVGWSIILDIFIWCIMYYIDKEELEKATDRNTDIKQKNKTITEKIVSIKPKWIITAAVILTLIFSVSFKDNNKNPNASTETLSNNLTETINTENATETEAPAEVRDEAESELTEEPPKTVNGVEIDFTRDIPNDVTGNWRLACVATEKEIQEYALDYYSTYFQSDDEIHAIVNFTLNTTNGLSKINSDTLEVAVYDYVDNEEHDANILFSGTQLADYEINTSTGEITQIMPETEQQTEEQAEAQQEEQAEPEIAAPSENAAPEPAPEAPADTAGAGMVWLSATGSKYHSIPNCGKMNPDNARQVSKEDAESRGYSACSKCH